MLYIDTCCYDDYDKVVAFLLKHNISIKDRSKMEMVVSAEMSRELASQMLKEVNFNEAVSYGENPL